MRNIFQRMFPFLGLLVLLLFVGQTWKDRARPYLEYQKRFGELAEQKAGGVQAQEGFETGVRQRWIKELDRSDRCESCHLGIEDPRFQDAQEPFLSHPNMNRHRFDRFGCTVCHGGQGRATTLQDAHGPVANWHDAIYHQDFMENSCSLCHGEFMGALAPVLSAGIRRVVEDGCRGCHKIRGKERNKVGPPLDELGKRVRTDWLFRWIRNPRAYLPLTRMPDAKFSEQASADVAKYLLQGPAPLEMPITGSADQGKLLFAESRCVSCHSVEGRGGKIAPDLGRVASKAYPERLARVIGNPQELWPATQMPVFGFSDREIQDLVAFLIIDYVDLELEEDRIARQTQLVEKADMVRGREWIEKQGCTGCHDRISGVEDRGEIGVELTSIGAVHISRLDFGDVTVDREHRTVPNWLYNKMKNPRLFGPDLKMPDYSFTDREAEAVTTYLLSLRAEEVPASYRLPLGDAPSAYAPQGKFGKILDKYRCLVCHKINGKGGEMATDLSQEGSRVRKEWLQKFMKTPDTIRPMLEERMTQFKMLDSETEELDAYFRTTLVDNRVENLEGAVSPAALTDSGRIATGERLYLEKYACHACHQIKLAGGVVGPDLTAVGRRLRVEWILYYLRDPKAFVAKSLEPVYRFDEEETLALAAFLVNLQ